MSVSTEVQRTLVKSPPELWSELSNPEALARHLADLGEIRITAVEPETKVEWEAESASGVVQLKPSGWGTKVTLSVKRNRPISKEPPEPEPATLAVIEPEPVVASGPRDAESEPCSTPEPDPEPIANVEPDPERVAATRPDPEPIAVVEPNPEPIVVGLRPETIAEPEPELGFFARLFRRRKATPAATDQPEPTMAVEPVATVEPDVEPEIATLAAPEPIYPDPPVELKVDLAAELEAMEAQMVEETTELLTGVLDRLGAAHHRPFSRG